MPPKPTTQDRTAIGLMLHPNPYALPEGALLEADNVVIDRPGVISKSRGVDRYGDALSGPARAVSEFDNTVVLLDGTTLKYDSDGAGTWANMAGTFNPPDADHRMRFIESLFSLYYTSSGGIYRLDELGNDPKPAGMPQGLDIQASFNGTGLGWMLGNTQVAYKVVWLREDANGQEIPGAASFREVVTNSKTDVTWTFSSPTVTVAHVGHGYTSGDTVQITEADSGNEAVESPTTTITVTGADEYTYDIAGSPGASGTAKAHRIEEVSFVSTIPDGVEAGDFYEVYRTEQSANDTTDPGARYLKVNRVEVDASDITAGSFIFVDDFDEAFLGVGLVSNPTSEGLQSTNDRPPFARDLAFHKGFMFYANTRRDHFLDLQFLETTALVAGTSSITIGARTYTAETAEDIGSQEFLLETGLTTEAENVEATMKSLVRVINRDSGNSVFYAYYTSGALDPPGKILIRRRDFTDTALSVTVDASTTGDNFSPVLPTSGTSVSTESDAAPNRLYRSKFEQPDAVPLTSFDPIGAARDAILRIISIRDSLLIFTERSIYILSGEDEQSFTIRVLEKSVRLLAPESCAVLNGSVLCFTNQGVGSANENGFEIESFLGIERELSKIQNFPNYKTLTWGVGYEQDRKYVLWTQSQSGDTTATVGWQFNYLTNTWTRRKKKVVAGVVLKEGDRLFLAHAVDPNVLRERKSFGTGSGDFRDEDIPITITSVGTTTDSAGNTVSQLVVTFTYTTEPLATEWLISQGFSTGRVSAIVDSGGGSFTLDLETLGSYTAGAATAGIPILSRVRWAPEVAGNSTITKMFPYCTISMEADTYRSVRIGFVSDVIETEGFVNPLIILLSSGWGSAPWGSSPWGAGGPIKSTPLRIPVPRRFRRCRGLSTIIEHNKTNASFEILNMGLVPRGISDRSLK